MTTNLKSVSLVEKCGNYGLRLVYEVEDLRVKKKITIPFAELDIDRHSFAVYTCSDEGHRINIGLGQMLLHKELVMSKNGRGVTGFVVEEIIEEKIHEMTLEEVEKKLGYKVKIVSEK